MKKSLHIMASLALIILLANLSSCRKDKTVCIDQKLTLENIIKTVDANLPLSLAQEKYVEQLISEGATSQLKGTRGDSIWLPTLMGSGSIIEFWPNYLQANNIGTLGFYFPPRDLASLIILKIDWKENGHQRRKVVHTVIHKMGDEYDIWTLYLNKIIRIDYGTVYTATTTGINSRGFVQKVDHFGPYVYIEFKQSNNFIFKSNKWSPKK